MHAIVASDLFIGEVEWADVVGGWVGELILEINVENNFGMVCLYNEVLMSWECIALA